VRNGLSSIAQNLLVAGGSQRPSEFSCTIRPIGDRKLEAAPPSAEASPGNRRQWDFVERHGLLLVGVSPVLASMIGSAFNIFYNKNQIWPLLSTAQIERFDDCWQIFNLIIYPLAVGSWAAPLVWLRPIHRAMLAGEPVDAARLSRAQRYAVNLPWWILTVSGACWLLCIPVFPTALAAVPEPLSVEVVWHLVTSFITAGLISVTHSFFAVELVSQRALFPVFFRNENPADVPGAIPLGFTGRGVMWALAAVVSPIFSLVLLLLLPEATRQTPLFGIAVGAVAIAFGLTTAWMFGKQVVEPVRKLRQAAMEVSDGNLDVRVNLLRANEFGALIEGFNQMVEGLHERELLQETFGRHVGREAARLIMLQGDGLVGSAREVTVMFVDVRNFTDHSSRHTPEEVVTVLNILFREAVEIVEAHGGMVNKFLGDGFMALFGVGAGQNEHATRAVEAAQSMLASLDHLAEDLYQAGWPELKIGIGINTGQAIVGSIGSPKRQEYTAIGDTVNVAARVEALTKTLGHDLLITEACRCRLPAEFELVELARQKVKGKGELLRVYAVAESSNHKPR